MGEAPDVAQGCEGRDGIATRPTASTALKPEGDACFIEQVIQAAKSPPKLRTKDEVRTAFVWISCKGSTKRQQCGYWAFC